MENKESKFKTTIVPYFFQFPDEAMRFWDTSGTDVKNQMARVYQQAFAGPPWFERYACTSCDCYTKEPQCGTCGSQELPEAYPLSKLVEEYFPSMLTTFSPSVLTLARSRGLEGEVIGFCTGGITTIEELVYKKYKGNKSILEEISTSLGLSPSERVFYENEACTSPEYQGIDVGTVLSLNRAVTVLSRIGDACVFAGRSINPNWLRKKKDTFERVFSGYEYLQFVPKADTYEVDGLKRYFYAGIPQYFPGRRLPNYIALD